MVCLVRAQVRTWRYTGVGLALGCVVLWGWEHPVEAQTFMQSSKVEVMGGGGPHSSDQERALLRWSLLGLFSS